MDLLPYFALQVALNVWGFIILLIADLAFFIFSFSMCIVYIITTINGIKQKDKKIWKLNLMKLIILLTGQVILFLTFISVSVTINSIIYTFCTALIIYFAEMLGNASLRKPTLNR